MARTILLLLLLAPTLRGLEFEEARHLLTRTGFAPTREEIAAYLPLSREEAVARLLDGHRREVPLPPPAFVEEAPPDPRETKMLPAFLRQGMRQEKRAQGQELKGWWYRVMCTTPSPLTERMTLFWHNHFTSSLQKTKWPPLMYRQNRLLRGHALGSFREMLHAIARDPAMVIYLDNARNLARKPNENFAREVMELFTLGEGRYTEADIREAARAFTGWGVDRSRGSFHYRVKQHDYGLKTILGRTGNFGGEEVLDLLLEQPECARHLSRKLWREFLGGEGPPEEIEGLARVLRRSGYRIRPWLEAALLHPAFWDPRRRGSRIKSPVELLVGTTRLLGAELPDPLVLVRAGRQLGQDILDPPNVKGWPGGTRWISADTLLKRSQLLRKALRGMRGSPGVEALSALPRAELTRLLLPIEPVDPLPRSLSGFRLLQALLLDPAYQLQ